MKKKSVIKQIYDCLKQAGLEVYFPTQHLGECISDYVVVAYEGSTKSISVSSEQAIYSVLCYVPNNRYSYMFDLVEKTKSVLRGLFPLIRPTGNETSPYYDEDIDGHMISIEYVNYRKIEYRN